VLLAKVPVGRLEPTLFSLECLGVTAVHGVQCRPGLLLAVRCFLRFGRVRTQLDFVPLGAEFERTRLEPGGRGFELGKVHFLDVRGSGVLVRDRTRFLGSEHLKKRRALY